MKVRPILFSGPMVRAILAGTKTQTRRVVSPQPYIDACGNFCWNGLNFGQSAARVPHVQSIASSIPSSKTKRVHCPYGKPGDRLWGREAFAIVPRTAYACSDGVQQTLRPDDPYEHDAAIYREGWCRSTGGFKWRPSIHMPRWASRILLEIVSVRVERLQDISEADAESEGVDFLRHIPDADETLTARQLYECLWEYINGPGSWAANPWVWVVEFKRAIA